jgi:hypothetical protein
LSFNIRYCLYRGTKVEGISGQSTVYEVAVINRRLKRYEPDADYLRQLKDVQPIRGWARLDPGYWEVTHLSTAQSRGDLPFVAGENLGDRIMVLPVNKDVELQLRWDTGPVFEAAFAQELLSDATKLAAWLMQHPKNRSAVNLRLGHVSLPSRQDTRPHSGS